MGGNEMIICPKCKVAFDIKEGECPFCGMEVKEYFNYERVEDSSENTYEQASTIELNDLKKTSDKMFFEQREYLESIKLLEIIKTFSIIGFTILFGYIGFLIGDIKDKLSFSSNNYEFLGILIGSGIGILLGWILSLFLNKIIQEAYWRIDVLNTLKRVENKKEGETQDIK